MHKPEISLFHHPTTTVFVDDSEEFLYSVALGVDRLPYRSFCNASEGLAYVNQFTTSYDVPSRERPPSSSASVSKLFAQVERKLVDHNRFAEPSVLVVDYSMPSMNGLELCSQITNPNIKRLLLTGVADEKIAIDALNTELIDFYISKSESSLSHRLRSIITHLETRYFQDLFGWSRDTEVRSVLPQLFDPAFADFFEETLEDRKIVEHYPLREMTGFCLINGYGGISHLVVYSERELELLLSKADLSQMSETKRKQLKQGQLIPYCPPHVSPVIQPREGQLFASTIIGGKQNYYCALVDEHHLPAKVPSNRTTYHQFLKTPPSYAHGTEGDKRQ